MLRILVDCCLSVDWVPLLSAAGHEAVHWKTLGDPSDPDDKILGWAARHDHIVLSHDLDFATMLMTHGLVAPSVVQIRSESHLPKVVGNLVLAALADCAEQLNEGAIVTVDYYRTRVRSLKLE